MIYNGVRIEKPENTSHNSLEENIEWALYTSRIPEGALVTTNLNRFIFWLIGTELFKYRGEIALVTFNEYCEVLEIIKKYKIKFTGGTIPFGFEMNKSNLYRHSYKLGLPLPSSVILKLTSPTQVGQSFSIEVENIGEIGNFDYDENKYLLKIDGLHEGKGIIEIKLNSTTPLKKILLEGIIERIAEKQLSNIFIRKLLLGNLIQVVLQRKLSDKTFHTMRQILDTTRNDVISILSADYGSAIPLNAKDSRYKYHKNFAYHFTYATYQQLLLKYWNVERQVDEVDDLGINLGIFNLDTIGTNSTVCPGEIHLDVDMKEIERFRYAMNMLYERFENIILFPTPQSLGLNVFIEALIKSSNANNQNIYIANRNRSIDLFNFDLRTPKDNLKILQTLFAGLNPKYHLNLQEANP